MNHYETIVNEYKEKIRNSVNTLNETVTDPEQFKIESNKILVSLTEEAITKIKNEFFSSTKIAENEIVDIKQKIFAEHKKQEEIMLKQIRAKLA